MRRLAAFAILASLGALAACAALIGLEPGEPRDDAGPDAPDSAASIYSDIGDDTKWTTFDLSSLLGGAMAAGYIGGACDGRFVYFAPAAGSIMLRYDTNLGFGMSSSWEKFDVASVNMNARNFFGAALETANRVVYAPFSFGQVPQYDDQKPFDAGFTFLQTPGGASGFVGVVSDGRALYFVPHFNPTTMMYAGRALRYQLEAGADASPWSAFDFTTNFNANATGYYGGVFDGRYVYYAPYQAQLAARYDTMLAFTDVMAWKTFDLKTIQPNTVNYTTAAFDGRFVYLIPRGGSNGPHGLVVRVDTSLPFDKVASWSVFDTTQINPTAKGFGGSAFDGRYLYLAPTQNGLFVRYDTARPFSAVSSWSSFDVGTKASTAKSYLGGVFDGKYIYFIPNASTVVARFEARSVGLFPLPYSGGSFF
jgi:hypothetical protein